ncbi:MAG: hypothetical protein EA411_04880 [Saprospirales bacterium]|nr:MAG: hypothetical protein EA411_04880 [Saprospirales bacterium]
MALIGKIRNNSWLLIVSLGLALAAFIIMDMTAPGDMAGGGQSSFTIGTVVGEEIDWRDFQQAEDILYSGSGADLFERREALWEYFVEKTIIQDMAANMGLEVGESEMEELLYGTNLSPIIRERFTDPSTGQVDRNQLNEIRQAVQTGNIEPGMIRFWRFQEDEVRNQRLLDKLNTVVHKGIYTPTFMAEDMEHTRGTSVSLDFINIPFTVIPDSEVEVSDSQLRNYLREHSREFERKNETRRVAYVSFDILPTEEDSMFLRNEMEAVATQMAITDDLAAFTDMNQGQFDEAYFRENELSSNYANRLFNMEIGEVYGPFISDGYYSILKLYDRKPVPDSVRSRHILRFADNNVQLAEEERLLDSLITVLESGAESFDSLAAEFGMDATFEDGGDLGYVVPGDMVKPFNDLIFYQAEPGQYYTVRTQFGVHLVEVTDRIYSSEEEGVRFAVIEEPIIPSEETQNAMYDQVLRFVAENRTIGELELSAEESPELTLTTSNFFTRNDFSIQGLGSNTTSRDIIRWAFSRSVRTGEVSPEIYGFQHDDHFFTEKYVVVGLTDIESAGLPSVSAVRSTILPRVMNKKKGEKIASAIDGMSLQQIADKYQLAVEQAMDVNLGDGFIPGIGSEPAVIGALKTLESGQHSGPVIGTSGVYALEILNKVEPPQVSITSQVRRQLSAQKRDQVARSLIESLKETVDIEDTRYRVY